MNTFLKGFLGFWAGLALAALLTTIYLTLVVHRPLVARHEAVISQIIAQSQRAQQAPEEPPDGSNK